MYLPPHFNKSKDLGLAARIVREHPFASLISNDDEGFPFVTHLPLHLIEDGEGEETKWKMLGHGAKPNPHWKFLAARPEALITFMGPQAYMSPKVYPDLARVPTWNYLAVHCKVRATLIEAPEAKDSLLKPLIGDHEPPYKQQWINLGQEYQHKMLMGIVAFELDVLQIECKVKINQHRPEAVAKMLEIYERGNEQERALAQWMRSVSTQFSS